MHMSACALGGQKRAPESPRTGAAGCCKPSDMGAENYTQGVCRRTKAFCVISATPGLDHEHPLNLRH